MNVGRIRTRMRWFIDAMNVIGSRPDGWWRDRDGAMRRFIAEVGAWATEPVTIVLDSGPDDLVTSPGVRVREDGRPNPVPGDVTVVRAARRGRDAADDEIV